MGHLLNSGEVGNIGLEHLKQIRSKTINKWDSLGFLEGLKRSRKREHCSVIRKPSFFIIE